MKTFTTSTKYYPLFLYLSMAVFSITFALLVLNVNATVLPKHVEEEKSG